MNKSYKSLWNEATGSWVAVSELGRAKGKGVGSRTSLLLATALLATGAAAQQIDYAAGDVRATPITVPVAGTATLNSLDAGVATQSGAIDGDGGVAKTGAGTIVLSGTNSYTGGTVLNAGTLEAATDGALGTGMLTINGGTLRGGVTLANEITINNSFTVAPLEPPQSLQSGLTLTGNIQLNTTPTINFIDPPSSTAYVVRMTGVVSGAHGMTLDTPIGAYWGVLAFGGTQSNTYTGLTTVRGNTLLALARPGAISVPSDLLVEGPGVVATQESEQIADTATVTVNSTGHTGTLVSMSPNPITLEGLTLGGSGLVETIGTLNGVGTVGLGSSELRVGAGDFSGVISDGVSGLAGSGGALTKYGPGTLTLSGANSHTGATAVMGGVLRAAAVNTLSAASAHAVSAGATLDIGGFNQTVPSLANSGTVSLLSAAPGTDLTVTGAYVGNNGVLRIGTTLGATGPSDRLVLDGPGASASGNTTLQVVNRGGLGALTTGNGIEVIAARNGATSTSDAFSLAGGHVDAGAYEYRLHEADAAGAGESWYLRSALATVPNDPTTPNEPGAPAVTPIYRAEVPLLAALPAQLRRADLAMLGNLHQRIGDDDVKGAGPLATGGARRAWGRVIATNVDVRQQGTVAASSDGDLRGFQAGTDLYVAPNTEWRAGVYVGQLDGDIDVTGFARGISNLAVGSNDLRSQYLGAYATYANAAGFYADAVLQLGRQRYTLQPEGNAAFSGKGDSQVASIEVGQSFALGGQWKIEPQLQLIHQRTNLDDLNLGGTLVRQQTDNGWIARAGVRVKGEIATGAGMLQPYGRLNFYKASSGTDIARFINPAATTDIASRTGGSSAELAAGATLALSPTTSLYGEIGKLVSLGGDAKTKSAVQGSIGVRVRW